MDGKKPLDASAAHPEAYPVVKAFAEKNRKDIKPLIGYSTFLEGLHAVSDTHLTLPQFHSAGSSADPPLPKNIRVESHLDTKPISHESLTLLPM
ncbi:hypothetical protein UF37_12910, partial [Vibrio parahaemolyticus]